jgi:hypothetical protein
MVFASRRPTLIKFVAYLRRHHIGLLALFIALGGTSYAVSTGGIDSREIKNNTIRSEDVRNGALLGKDFRKGQLRAGSTGPQGPPGQAGPQGPPGEVGSSGALREYELVSNATDFPSEPGGRSAYSGSVECPAGKKILGAGGWTLTAAPTYSVPFAAASIEEQLPSDTEYSVALNSVFALFSEARLTVTAACAPVQP